MGKLYWLKAIVAAVGIVVVTGCAQLADLAKEQRVSTYNAQEDNHLTSALYQLTNDERKDVIPAANIVANGWGMAKVNTFSLHYIKQFASMPNAQSIRYEINKYSKFILDEEPAKIYVRKAKERGSVVKLYKPALSNLVNKNFKQGFFRDPAKHTEEWYGIDNMLIEYSKNGEVLSFMTRSMQAVTSLGVDASEYLNIYYGRTAARALENGFKNSVFLENYIRDI